MRLTKLSRDHYHFSSDFFSDDGRARFEDFASARKFAAQVTALRSQPLPASDLYALSLIDEALRALVKRFAPPPVMTTAVSSISEKVGADSIDQTQKKFVAEFPPESVYLGEQKVEEYLAKLTNGRVKSVEELIYVFTHNANPAVSPMLELVDDAPLELTAYKNLISALDSFFAQIAKTNANISGSTESLFDILRAPAEAFPDSLEGQLQFILEKWGVALGDEFASRLLRGVDFLREETLRHHLAHGDFKANIPVATYSGGDYAEYEKYSPDKEWMPRIILIAKNSYVWLEQLSRKYGRWIKTLDQIPDEELDLLRDRGFTGLWLIGLWERSRASQRIKQRMGDADAVASAYSLFSYDIAEDLGGWGALENLRSRAWQRGIRLSADMVPNHMGIDSQWVIEHPDWFLSVPHSPYPSYSFKSENLSDDIRVGIYLEDHYYSKTDAAVVFQRRDHHTGDVRYIYHGNDGTSFPWNDTAQLDYSKAEVREAIIQTILHVARNFPVIRFDAAMTLAKKHIQRLWFPEPGFGGAVPSRSEHGMTRSEFDALIPQEFWREVVDRVAAEVPDTLLLAEAFWLLEGYFVRTLGMHRVYNSAFMHMLRDEDNAKYRAAIKNTLEFDPQILKRYVNFMNNPDEKTAVEQFGDGDKYFGIATVLSTLPGLPMFGHGQVEGFREKYGMEFRKPKMDETPNEGLVAGHDWKIFPILHRRSLFADVENFYLYDFYSSNGNVDENVFAYSNIFQDERGLVLYHNRFADTKGWIKTSAAYLDKSTGDLRQKSLAEALGLPFEGYVIFKDYVTRLEYIRSCEELWSKGLYVELHAYQHHVFMDFRFIDDEKWRDIYVALNGAGVESMSAKWEEMFGVKDEGGMMKDEEVKVKKPRKKAVKKKEERGKKVVGGKITAVKKAKPAVTKLVTKKAVVKKKSAVKKPVVKKSTAKASKSKPKANRKKVVKKPAKR
ncbi:MAG TPA: alpha-amylase family glycosyl hydrolase [Anaerolineales bacterium]|nr:alpha-amylase family glycosyl hydrolase [Anaerolineales bacterium]HQX14988.1 alpha-amylase family glycosyl hydrolase [Anaerolineales bacterium]